MPDALLMCPNPKGNTMRIVAFFIIALIFIDVLIISGPAGTGVFLPLAAAIQFYRYRNKTNN
jgi:hypothetical protein